MEKNTTKAYSLDSTYYTKSFDSIDELIEDVIRSGMDPNLQVTKNGVGIGENAIDFITF